VVALKEGRRDQDRSRICIRIICVVSCVVNATFAPALVNLHLWNPNSSIDTHDFIFRRTIIGRSFINYEGCNGNAKGNSRSKSCYYYWHRIGYERRALALCRLDPIRGHSRRCGRFLHVRGVPEHQGRVLERVGEPRASPRRGYARLLA